MYPSVFLDDDHRFIEPSEKSLQQFDWRSRSRGTTDTGVDTIYDISSKHVGPEE